MKTRFILPLALSLAACGNSNKVQTNPGDIKPGSAQVQIIKGANHFGFNLLQEIIQGAKPEDNIFISPLSVHTALGMAWNGAAGKTRDQMNSSLYFPAAGASEINSGYKMLIDGLLAADKNVHMDIANSIWYRKDFSIKRSFLELNKDYFNAQVSALDFSDPQASSIINKWVAEKTRNKIQAIVDDIQRDHVMFLINAVYFKGIWQQEFKKENTRNMPFMLADGSQKQVMTMETTASFNYTEREGYRVIELPYGDGNFSMVVMLPDKGLTVDKLIAGLDQETWNELDRELNSRYEINLRLPRFSFSYDTELKDPLINLGIKDAFVPQFADFSAITDDDIYISRVKHKSFVEVNEEGTEAAAVTSIEFRTTSMPAEPRTFHVDRPFVFALKEKSTNALLFIGRVMDPGKR